MLRGNHRVRLLSSTNGRNPWKLLGRGNDAPLRESRAAPLPLPPPKYLMIRDRCTFEYIDIRPQEGHEPSATIVLVHGAPGSYKDFRHLIPVLSNPHTRIIGINLPGYAGSKVTTKHYLEEISALPSAELTLEAVKELCNEDKGSDKVFLVGHSFGAHTVINMAALQATDDLKLRGVALLAPAGCRPHKALRTNENAMIVKLLRKDNPVISVVTSHLVKLAYTKILGFPSNAPPEHYIAGLVRAGTTDFGVIGDHVDLLCKMKLPSFIAWSQNDEFMEEEVPAELAQLCHPGPRLVFAGGGHNIQKTRAEQVAAAMKKWIVGVLAQDEEGQSTMQHLP